jgi:hypothetical protein
MMKIASRTITALIAVTLLSIGVTTANAQSPQAEKPLPTIAEKTASTQSHDGFFKMFWDERHGKVWIEIDKFNEEFLLIDSLPAGVGSNDIGLDRGQPGSSRVVQFERIGPKVLLVQQNYDFRATSDNPFERRAVADAFARSVLWGFDVAAEDNGHVLIDATPFLLTDLHYIAETLKNTKQGSFHIDASRSAIYLAQTKNFPLNTEVESTLTFVGDEPGKLVREVTPDPHAITVRQHISFVHLPEPGYKPRAFDPRSGFFGMEFLDYSAPAGESNIKRYTVRYRLQKKDPSAAISEAVKPIVYYLDPGTPEPIRSALLDGAKWWNQAFEAAGYKNAFRVEMLPPDVDPMDIRYNVIEWIHRSTRGWAYGSAVIDPRTGEIINGHVSLDSLRWRQDYLILEGMLAPYKDGTKTDPRLLETVLARIRQLSAHELGHTLGLSHNYIASTQNRASVMDYPHPLLNLGADGSVDTSDAYAKGIGEWDKVSIQFGYSDFAPGTDEHAALNRMIDDARKRGLTYLTDQDARPPGSPHPLVHLWDNGSNAVDELNRILSIRAKALYRFGENVIQQGTPLAQLSDTLVPVYFYHRYQTTAAIKVIGGETYTYALRGDGQVPTTAVPDIEQRRALSAVLKTLAPETLSLPARITSLIPPHPAGYSTTRESFTGRTGLTFDPLAAAEASTLETLSVLLNPERAARLVQYHGFDEKQLGLGEVLDKLVAQTWKSPATSRQNASVQRTVADVVLQQMIALASNEKAAPEVRAITALKLHELSQWAAKPIPATTGNEDERAHLMAAVARVRDFENHPGREVKPTEPISPPPGMPIGSAEEEDFSIPGIR